VCGGFCSGKGSEHTQFVLRLGIVAVLLHFCFRLVAVFFALVSALFYCLPVWFVRLNVSL